MLWNRQKRWNRLASKQACRQTSRQNSRMASRQLRRLLGKQMNRLADEKTCRQADRLGTRLGNRPNRQICRLRSKLASSRTDMQDLQGKQTGRLPSSSRSRQMRTFWQCRRGSKLLKLTRKHSGKLLTKPNPRLAYNKTSSQTSSQMSSQTSSQMSSQTSSQMSRQPSRQRRKRPGYGSFLLNMATGHSFKQVGRQNRLQSRLEDKHSSNGSKNKMK